MGPSTGAQDRPFDWCLGLAAGAGDKPRSRDEREDRREEEFIATDERQWTPIGWAALAGDEGGGNSKSEVRMTDQIALLKTSPTRPSFPRPRYPGGGLGRGLSQNCVRISAEQNQIRNLNDRNMCTHYGFFPVNAERPARSAFNLSGCSSVSSVPSIAGYRSGAGRNLFG